ncbi:MAG: sulfatase-like hydrolase/transferase [Kiritimatiellae bacterium]|nr:sulfatase-like hydrolase/transferase [Kiritimatiellia bacterium]
MAECPNVLVIMSDQHNPHVMGCAGHPLVRTPALDRLAEHGVRFADVACSGPICVPARAGFMTGRLPSDIRVWSLGCVLPSDIPTFAHAFNLAGYESILCGRMHFLGPDQFHGFQHRLLGEVETGFVSDEDRRHKTYAQTASAVKNVVGPGDSGYQAYDREAVKTCCNWLREQAGKTRERPFMMVTGLVSPHNPLRCEADLFESYLPQVELPQVPEAYLSGLHPAIRAWRERREVDSITADETRRALAAYLGLVTFTDRLVGRIVNTLAETGLLEHTIVVYTTDHGDMAGEHGMWWKSNFYQGSIGVPLIIAWPTRFRQGATVNAVASLCDVGPTLLDVCGAPPLPGAWGRSLRGFLETDGKISDWRNEAVAEYSGLLGERPAYMLRSGPWKLNTYLGYDEPQLFNLQEDPDEFHDRAADPACARIKAELIQRVKDEWDGKGVERLIKLRWKMHEMLQALEHKPLNAIPKWRPPRGVNTLEGKILE